MERSNGFVTPTVTARGSEPVARQQSHACLASCNDQRMTVAIACEPIIPGHTLENPAAESQTPSTHTPSLASVSTGIWL